MGPDFVVANPSTDPDFEDEAPSIGLDYGGANPSIDSEFAVGCPATVAGETGIALYIAFVRIYFYPFASSLVPVPLFSPSLIPLAFAVLPSVIELHTFAIPVVEP